MLTLFHKGLATCAQVNPNGYVSTLIHDGRIVTESRIINEYINDAFDGPELLPDDHYDRARVSLSMV